jgi:hypothetical protein
VTAMWNEVEAGDWRWAGRAPGRRESRRTARTVKLMSGSR